MNPLPSSNSTEAESIEAVGKAFFWAFSGIGVVFFLVAFSTWLLR